MSDVTPISNASESTSPQYSINGAYHLRNTSLETGSSPLLLRSGIQPDMKLELRVHINPLEHQDEVVLDLTVSARDNSNLLYIIKVQQAGCFVLTNFTPEQKTFFLNVNCPNLLYPYASQFINTLAVQAGFPAVNLIPVDFAEVYAQKQQQEASQAQSSNSPPEIEPAAQPIVKPENKWTDLAVPAD